MSELPSRSQSRVSSGVARSVVEEIDSQTFAEVKGELGLGFWGRILKRRRILSGLLLLGVLAGLMIGLPFLTSSEAAAGAAAAGAAATAGASSVALGMPPVSVFVALVEGSLPHEHRPAAGADDWLWAAAEHDPAWRDPQTRPFTQGLVKLDASWLETGGMYGKSILREFDLAGRTTRYFRLPAEDFAEDLAWVDLAWWGGRGRVVLMLTWACKLHIVDYESFEVRATLAVPLAHAWGLALGESSARLGDETRDAPRKREHFSLFITDGTARLHEFAVPDLQRALAPALGEPAPPPLELRRVQTLTCLGREIPALNAMQYRAGTLLGAVWRTPLLFEFDVLTGGCTAVMPTIGVYDPRHARLQHDLSDDVLNGAAVHDREESWVRATLTGKRWPQLWHLTFCSLHSAHTHALCKLLGLTARPHATSWTMLRDQIEFANKITATQIQRI